MTRPLKPPASVPFNLFTPLKKKKSPEKELYGEGEGEEERIHN